MQNILNNTTRWGAEADKIQANFVELYAQANHLIDLTAFTVNDTDDLYAHESQILIHHLGDKTVLLVMYTSDKVSSSERQTSAHCLLKVFDLTTKAHIRTIDLFYPGLVAGLTQPNEAQTAPRMYITGTTIRCFVGTPSGLYTRTITISDSNVANWTVSNLSVMQMTMKDSGGSNVLVNCVAANFQTHLKYVLGDDYAGYASLAPFFRNLDRIAVSGANWYTILELTDELGAGLSNILILLKSTDSGVSWTFQSVICYTSSARTRMLEASIVFVDTVMHVISRHNTGNVAYTKSTDSGATWSALSYLPLSTLASKVTAINYYKPDNSIGVVVALQLASEVTGSTYRTTLGIYTTVDFYSFVEIGKIATPSYAHYPSLCHYGRALYISYTKALRRQIEGTSHYAYDRDTIVIARVY